MINPNTFEPVFFHFECIPNGRVLEVGFLFHALVVEDNTVLKRWCF